MKYLLLLSIAAVSSYSASAQHDDIYYLQKQLSKKTNKKWDYFEKNKKETLVITNLLF